MKMTRSFSMECFPSRDTVRGLVFGRRCTLLVKFLKGSILFTARISFIGILTQIIVTPAVLTKADPVVFYSLTARKWKVGDFGLTSEGFSEMQKTTLYGRGTQGYRAPELLQRFDFEAEEKSFYSKKSDIWALGCVFYEATFSKKLFKQDIDTHGWVMSRSELKFPIGDLGVDPLSATRIEVLLGRVLSPDPVNRPAAKDLFDQLGYWGEQPVPVL